MDNFQIGADRATPPSRRALPALEPLRNRIARLGGELRQALLDGQPTAVIRAGMAAAETDLAAAQTAVDEEIARVAAATAQSQEAELDAADVSWRAELADFIGPVPLELTA